MKCPSCKDGELIPDFLDKLFPCNTCNSCQGNWVMLENYVRWKQGNPDFKFEPEASAEILEAGADDSDQALKCPVTGQLMFKFKISHKLSHRLDLSPSIAHIWLDKGEWALIKASGLAGSLNLIFSDAWQKKIRNEKSDDVMQQLYKERFGSDFEKISDFKSWINEKDNKTEIINFLLSNKLSRS